MSYLLDHYRMGGDPFHLGYTSVEQIGLGYLLTRGMVFPWTGGGTLLMRRRLYPTSGPWACCGFARPGEATIVNMGGFAHGANEAFQYVAATVLGNGFVSRLCEPVRVDFDAQGDRITPALPMHPLHVVATPIAGGKFRVTWEYDAFGQGGLPTDFQVFGGADPASVDYNTPLVDSVTGLSTIAYDTRVGRYTFTTAAYADGSERVFGVRGRNSAGVAEQNTYTSAPKRAVATTPQAATPAALHMRRV